MLRLQAEAEDTLARISLPDVNWCLKQEGGHLGASECSASAWAYQRRWQNQQAGTDAVGY